MSLKAASVGVGWFSFSGQAGAGGPQAYRASLAVDVAFALETPAASNAAPDDDDAPTRGSQDDHLASVWSRADAAARSQLLAVVATFMTRRAVTARKAHGMQLYDRQIDCFALIAAALDRTTALVRQWADDLAASAPACAPPPAAPGATVAAPPCAYAWHAFEVAGDVEALAGLAAVDAVACPAERAGLARALARCYCRKGMWVEAGVALEREADRARPHAPWLALPLFEEAARVLYFGQRRWCSGRWRWCLVGVVVLRCVLARPVPVVLRPAWRLEARARGPVAEALRGGVGTPPGRARR